LSFFFIFFKKKHLTHDSFHHFSQNNFQRQNRVRFFDSLFSYAA